MLAEGACTQVQCCTFKGGEVHVEALGQLMHLLLQLGIQLLSLKPLACPLCIQNTEVVNHGSSHQQVKPQLSLVDCTWLSPLVAGPTIATRSRSRLNAHPHQASCGASVMPLVSWADCCGVTGAAAHDEHCVSGRIAQSHCIASGRLRSSCTIEKLPSAPGQRYKWYQLSIHLST